MSASACDSVVDRAGKYLTFKLMREEYGIPILKVKEIIGIMSITRVPGAPGAVRGVINLRGKVIPVVDLRLRFDMEFREYNGRTCIIVVQIDKGGVEMTMGIIVDEVSEVVNVAADQIEPPPSYGVDVSNEFLLGMGKVGQRVLILLDIDGVLTNEELAQVASASS